MYKRLWHWMFAGIRGRVELGEERTFDWLRIWLIHVLPLRRGRRMRNDESHD